jgi:signal transduction histidine kinase
MDALLAGVVQSLRRQADDRGAEVGVEGSLPDLVSDRVALEQVFSNLVENALKYLKPGRPGRIVVRGRREAGRVVYEVEDNGRGVDPRDHERIFELFRRAGAQDQPGEGIGLAHVRALVYRLGGTIDCVSALDQGATFRISLPAALKREETQAP